MAENLIAFISAVIISFIMTPLARRLAIRVGAMDVPKETRKIHNKPMPYFGGLAIYVAIMACMFVYMPHSSTNFYIMIGATILLFAGVVDDGLMSVSQLIDMDFFGINLGLTPSISPGALFGPEMLTYLLLLIFPILVVLTSFVSMQYSQRMMAGGKSSSDRKAEKEKAKNNPALQETSPDAMANQGKMMMWIMPIMMLMFTLNAPVAMSLYYIISNVLMIFQYWLFNKIYNEPLALRQAESDAEWERTIKARAEKEKAELEKIEESSSKKKRKRKARS